MAASLIILAAISVGTAVASHFLTPRPKLQPLDKGRLDDLRFQTAEEGGTRPKVYGLDVRLAGNVIDGSRTQEFVTTTPGRTGGKGGGGGRPAEPPTNHYTYRKTFAIEFCEGPILSFLEIKEDDQVIYNLAPPDVGSSYYEAEFSGNTLAGGALIVTDTTLVSRRKVNLPPAASVQWNSIPIDAAPGGTTQLVIYYQSTVSAAATVRVNSTDYPITLPSTGGALDTYVLTVAVNVGTNTVKITNNHGSATISIDQIFMFRGLIDDTTGIIDPIIPFPGDLDNPRGYYNYAAYRNERGEVTGNFSTASQAAFELYLGTEDQLQSPTLVALHGADNTPAYRGIAYFVANQFTLRNENGGRLGNITARVQPAIWDLADALTDMYLDRGADPSELNFSALAGITIDKGFVVNRRSPLSDYVDPLSLWYGFDLVPTGGTIKAVRRGGASVISIPESKLSAHEEGSERPAGPIVIDHVEETDIPGSVDVIYVDSAESKEFHTSSQHVEREVGNSLDPETLNFPIISDKDTAKAVGKRWLYEQVLKAKPLEFSTGPEFRYLIPTDVVTLPLSFATYVARIVSRQASFAGLVKFRALPEKAAVYTQVGVGQIGGGSEVPPVAYPPNTFLWLGDIPPLRLEDDALGYYTAVAPRGTGAGQWRGAHLFKELVPGTYDRVTGFTRAATMGVIASNVPAFTGDTTIFDRSTTITIDLFHDDGLITSRTEAELLGFPVNVLVIGSNAGVEILQFATATPQAASAPYVARYQLSTLLRSRLGTEHGALQGHSAGKTVVFLSDEVKFRHEASQELNTPRNFKGVSAGQAVDDAPVTAFTLEGYSKKHLAPTNARKLLDSQNNAVFQWMRRGRLAGNWRDFANVPLSDEEELYEIEVFNGANVVRTVRVGVLEEEVVQWAPGGYLSEHVTFANDGSGSASHVAVVGFIGGSTIFSRQTIDGPFRLEFEVYTAAGVTWHLPDFVMFEPASENPPTGSNLGFWRSLTLGLHKQFMPEHLNQYTVDAVAGDRFGMEYRDGQLFYLKNGAEVYRKVIPQAFAPYWLRIHFSGSRDEALKNPRLIRRRTPQWSYTADMQTGDGLTPGNPIHLKIYQVSALVGRGFPLDVTL